MANFRYSNRKLENPVSASLDRLKQASEFHNGVIIAYSGGKDSLTVADLACKVFKRVVGVFWYFVPGLEFTERIVSYAKDRWGIEVLCYPDPAFIESASEGHYRPPAKEWLKRFPKSDLRTTLAMARQDTGLQLVLTGKREADFNKRKMNLRVGKSTKEMHPIAKWSKYDVLSYLKRNDIPIPDQGRKDAGGIDLTAPSLLHLHDHHPNDFQRIARYFPFAPAVVKRRQFHNV